MGNTTSFSRDFPHIPTVGLFPNEVQNELGSSGCCRTPGAAGGLAKHPSPAGAAGGGENLPAGLGWRGGTGSCHPPCPGVAKRGFGSAGVSNPTLCEGLFICGVSSSSCPHPCVRRDVPGQTQANPGVGRSGAGFRSSASSSSSSSCARAGQGGGGARPRGWHRRRRRRGKRRKAGLGGSARTRHGRPRWGGGERDPGGERGSPEEQRGPPEEQRGTPEEQRGTPGSPGAAPGLPTVRQGGRRRGLSRDGPSKLHHRGRCGFAPRLRTG